MSPSSYSFERPASIASVSSSMVAECSGAQAACIDGEGWFTVPFSPREDRERALRAKLRPFEACKAVAESTVTSGPYGYEIVPFALANEADGSFESDNGLLAVPGLNRSNSTLPYLSPYSSSSHLSSSTGSALFSPPLTAQSSTSSLCPSPVFSTFELDNLEEAIDASIKLSQATTAESAQPSSVSLGLGLDLFARDSLVLARSQLGSSQGAASSTNTSTGSYEDDNSFAFSTSDYHQEVDAVEGDLGLGFIGRCSVDLRTSQRKVSHFANVLTDEPENISVGNAVDNATASPSPTKIQFAPQTDDSTGLRRLRLRASLPPPPRSATPVPGTSTLAQKALVGLTTIKTKAAGSGWFGKVKALGAKVVDKLDQLDKAEDEHSTYFNRRSHCEQPTTASVQKAAQIAPSVPLPEVPVATEAQPNLVRVSFAHIEVDKEASFTLGEDDDEDCGDGTDERSCSVCPTPKSVSSPVSDSSAGSISLDELIAELDAEILGQFVCGDEGLVGVPVPGPELEMVAEVEVVQQDEAERSALAGVRPLKFTAKSKSASAPAALETSPLRYSQHESVQVFRAGALAQLEGKHGPALPESASEWVLGVKAAAQQAKVDLVAELVAEVEAYHPAFDIDARTESDWSGHGEEWDVDSDEDEDSEDDEPLVFRQARLNALERVGALCRA